MSDATQEEIARLREEVAESRKKINAITRTAAVVLVAGFFSLLGNRFFFNNADKSAERYIIQLSIMAPLFYFLTLKTGKRRESKKP